MLRFNVLIPFNTLVIFAALVLMFWLLGWPGLLLMVIVGLGGMR